MLGRSDKHGQSEPERGQAVLVEVLVRAQQLGEGVTGQEPVEQELELVAVALEISNLQKVELKVKI